MKLLKLTLAAAAGALMLAGCTQTLQTTSGADYLARYDASYTPTSGGGSDVDADVRRIAAVEPDIRFPARIGLARIDGGRLVSVPADEAHIWTALAEDLGPLYGEFAPVSPMIAAMVSPKVAPRDRGYIYDSNPTQDVIADIRRGAARQHLDYVFVYEVGTSTQGKANAISLADLTVIGMFVLPSRSVEVEASASGILLDVRNGYPYATATAHAEKNGLSRAVSEYSRKRELADTAEELAVLKLSGEVKTAMEGLAKVSVARARSVPRATASTLETAAPAAAPKAAWWEK